EGRMRRTSWQRWAVGAVVFLAAACLVSGQAGLSLKEVLRRNVAAAGGKAKLAEVKNLSFRTGGGRNFVSASGQLKIVTGKDPVVTEVVLVNGGKVMRNSLDKVNEVAEPQRTVYQTLAKLYAGLFSLVRFEGELKLEGLRSFGPEKLYHLTPKSPKGPVAVHFYLRSNDLCLKRLVFQCKTAEGDKFEVNYDFGPFEETAGLRLPTTWFVSQVGTRGNLMEITDLKVNEPLGAGFFSTLDLNAGSVKAGPGFMEGNVLEAVSSPMGLIIRTNWTKKHVDQAGFKTGEELKLEGGGGASGFVTSVIIYLSANDVPPVNELAKGARILAPGPQGDGTFALLMAGPADPGLKSSAQVEPLTPISVRRIAK
ncbi:MAG TPA: hypothetical protein VEG35_06470, partial [Burkholderiales bacterium]|nr:hypothetical protein [Burkholderiales bacterium]